MPKPVHNITTYVLEKLDAETPARRATIYRDLAAIAASHADAKTFLSLAEDCERLDRAHEQLVLNFRRATR